MVNANANASADASTSRSIGAIDPTEQQTNDLVQLFSTTLHCLAADAAAVRQASSVAVCLDKDYKDSSTLRESLIQMEDLVSSLEEKVTILRQIVSEEKQSLTKFETTLQHEAEEQATLLEQMILAMQEYETKKRSSLDQVKEEGEDEDEDDNNNDDDDNEDVHDEDHGDNGDAQVKSRTSAPSRRDSVDPRCSSRHPESENQDPISVPRITQTELEDYRIDNVLGPRISLLDLNQALEEIEQLCQVQQHEARLWKRKHPQGPPSSSSSSGALQRRYDYLQKRQQLSIDESAISVTEQELRENCPFFRHGESTARATLSLLCSLKRLKQVPQKNRQVIYHLLV